jgi:hypothetical protein
VEFKRGELQQKAIWGTSTQSLFEQWIILTAYRLTMKER